MAITTNSSSPINGLGPMHDPRIQETQCRYVIQYGELAGQRCTEPADHRLVTCTLHGPAYMQQKQQEAHRKQTAQKRKKTELRGTKENFSEQNGTKRNSAAVPSRADLAKRYGPGRVA